MNQRTPSIIIDTDAGTDDFMAIAYLLALPAAPVEAITVVHGLAHVTPGARNLRRLLRLAGRDDIPVFEGEEEPLRGSRPFPAAWRSMTDELSAVRMPAAVASAPGESAVQFLKRRLAAGNDAVRILALGPLTNLALALRATPQAAIAEIVTMGGAVQVPGNLLDGNSGGHNEAAEWNIYCDPHAAAEVFALETPQLLVGLDATNRVPIDARYVADFARRDLTPLGRLVADVLAATLQFIIAGTYYAWDPLAAMALLDRSVVEARGARIEVVAEGESIGQTRLLQWDPASPFQVAVDADAGRFRAGFEEALVKDRY